MYLEVKSTTFTSKNITFRYNKNNFSTSFAINIGYYTSIPMYSIVLNALV